jgi:hypothetical protein
VFQSDQTPLTCWIDAAPSSGLIAVVIGDKYKVFRLKPDWQQSGRDNHWAETVAFELLARVLVARGHTGPVTVYSDSRTALSAFEGNKNRVQSIMESGQRLRAERDRWAFTMQPQWIGTKHNVADRFSRGKTNPGYEELRCSVKIPKPLKPFVSQN